MRLHITDEILDINFGGMGTVVTQLYKNRNSEDHFLLIGKSPQRPVNLPPEIFYLSKTEYFELKLWPFKYKYNLVHSFLLSLEIKIPNKIFVSHSDMLSEKRTNKLVFSKAAEFHLFSCLGADQLVFVSHYDQQQTRQSWQDTDLLKPAELQSLLSKPQTVICNGIDDQHPLEIHLKPVQPSLTLGYLGRIDGRKGIFKLIDSFPDQHQLLIAGGGQGRINENNYQTLCTTITARQARQPNPVMNVYPIGYCNEQRKNEFFNAIDALIVPSLYEPFGMVTLEAFQHGVPVISVDFGGPREVLGEGYPYYYQLDKPASLASVLTEIATNPPATNPAYLQFMQTTLNKYSAKKMATTYQTRFK